MWICSFTSQRHRKPARDTRTPGNVCSMQSAKEIWNRPSVPLPLPDELKQYITSLSPPSAANAPEVTPGALLNLKKGSSFPLPAWILPSMVPRDDISTIHRRPHQMKKCVLRNNVQSVGGDLWTRERLCPILRRYHDITTEGGWFTST
jgi:hypothetical protein